MPDAEKKPDIEPPKGSSQANQGTGNLYSRYPFNPATQLSSDNNIKSLAKEEAQALSKEKEILKREPQQEAKSVRSCPLGAHPRRKRSRTESVQQKDPDHYYARTHKKPDKDVSSDPSEAKPGTIVLAWS